jgi:hypothetical protein
MPLEIGSGVCQVTRGWLTPTALCYYGMTWQGCEISLADLASKARLRVPQESEDTNDNDLTHPPPPPFLIRTYFSLMS